MRFIYVMDPMCAWCYGFQPELETFLTSQPNAHVEWIMGGLAPDNDQPMDDSLKKTIALYWQQIEQKTQVKFNHDYWQTNTPYRSTYLACRAVLSAEQIKPQSAADMAKAIQRAYYQHAQNPSLHVTLESCADALGLDKQQFSETLKSPDIEQLLQSHLAMTRQLQVGGFPALFYVDDNKYAYPLTLGFTNADDLHQRFERILKERQ